MNASYDEIGAKRDRMIAEIAQMAVDTRSATGRASFGDAVMQAIARVPRHRFVPAGAECNAYENRAIGIGAGQTISQPFIVALMTDCLDVRPGDRVLEIGTGSGYQAAVLAELDVEVYSIEIIDALGMEARARLDALGYGSVNTRIGDGAAGWPEAAPFDAVIITAATPRVPQPLIDQLKPGGRLLVPMREPHGTQTLLRMSKSNDGVMLQRVILAVRFVPFTGPGING